MNSCHCVHLAFQLLPCGATQQAERPGSALWRLPCLLRVKIKGFKTKGWAPGLHALSLPPSYLKFFFSLCSFGSKYTVSVPLLKDAPATGYLHTLFLLPRSFSLGCLSIFLSVCIYHLQLYLYYLYLYVYLHLNLYIYISLYLYICICTYNYISISVYLYIPLCFSL